MLRPSHCAESHQERTFVHATFLPRSHVSPQFDGIGTKLFATLHQNGFCPGEVARFVRVKKWVVGFDWPVHSGDAVPLGEAIDLTQIPVDKRMAQISPDADWPKRDDRMRDTAGASASNLRIFFLQPRFQARDEIDRQKRRICWHADPKPTFGRCTAIQSRPARIPASGPLNPATSSATTGKPKSFSLAASPLAFNMSPTHCDRITATTRARMDVPPIVRSALSPPPMRCARPSASSTP
jgi:hypothetical protein